MNPTSKHATSTSIGIDLGKIFSGAAIGVIGKALGAMLQFGFVMSLTRLLGSTTAGIFFLGFALFQISSTIAGFSLDVAGRRYCQIVSDLPKMFYRLNLLFFASSIFTFLLIMSAMMLLPKLLPQGLSNFTLALFLLSGLSVGHLNLQTGMFQGIRMMAPATLVADIIYPAIRLILFWLLVAMGMHFQGALIALLLSGILSAVLGWVWLRSKLVAYVASINGDLPSKSDIIHYVGPIVFARLINISIVAGMPLLMGWLASTKDVAHFGAASRISMLVSIIIISVSAMFAPMISAYHAQGRMNDLKTLYQQVSAFTFLVASPIISICIFFPVEVMKLFGTDFMSGAIYLIPLALGQLFVVSLGAADQLVLMRGNSKLLMLTTAVGSGLAILLALVLHPIIGPIAFALGAAIGLSSVQLIILITIWRQDGLHPFDQRMVKINLVVWTSMAIALLVPTMEIKILAFMVEMILLVNFGMQLVQMTGILAQLKMKLSLRGFKS